MYVGIDTKTLESLEDGRRGPRTDIRDWLEEHPDTDVAVIWNTHSDDDGTVEYPRPGSQSEWKVPSNVSGRLPSRNTDLIRMKALLAVLQYRAHNAMMACRGRKLLIALTCGQAFDSRQALDGWKSLMKKEGEETG